MPAFSTLSERWRGRSALRWGLAAFVALLLAYVGSRFVFEVLLHRAVV